MEAMMISRFGAADVFEQITVPTPKVSKGHVLIKVHATSVNPLDYKLRQGVLPDLIPTFPVILHGDVAGVIEEIGEGVQEFSVGDEVYGCVGGFLALGGALAEYVLADAALIAHKPKTLSFEASAALPLVAQTAWEALVTYANVQRNQTVLIHGGTGGVGHIAIQLAKHLGAKVFTTASSSKKIDLCKELGADGAIHYRDTSVQSYVEQYTQNKGFDIVFDTVGGDNLPQCFEAAALFGKVVSLLAFGPYDLTAAFLKGLSLHLVMQPLPLITGVNRAHYGNILKEVAKLVDKGVIRPLIDAKPFSIAQVGAAHDYLEQGHAIGKVVLTVIA